MAWLTGLFVWIFSIAKGLFVRKADAVLLKIEEPAVTQPSSHIPYGRRGKFLPGTGRPKKARKARGARKQPSIPRPRPEISATHLADALEREQNGEFYFRDTILDQLDRYLVYLRRLKKTDKGNYTMMAEVGAQVIPFMQAHFCHWTEHRLFLEHQEAAEDVQKAMEIQQKRIHYSELSPWWKTNRPSFGAIVLSANSYKEGLESEDTERLRRERGKKWGIYMPKLILFRKYDKLGVPDVFQPAPDGWDVYVVSVVWDKPYDKWFTDHHKGGCIQEYGIGISPDGSEVRVLKTLVHRMRRIHSHKHGGDIEVPETCWEFQYDYVKWARFNQCGVEEFLKVLFIETTSQYELANSSMLRISAVKDGLTAIFNVDPSRMAYFFKDRDVCEETGRKARIFHAVKAHTRKDGKFVRMHFSGERQFKWAGFDVEITVPGLHSYLLPKVDIGNVDEAKAEPETEYMGMKEFVKFLDRNVIHPAKLPGIGSAVEGQVLPARRRSDEERKLS